MRKMNKIILCLKFYIISELEEKSLFDFSSFLCYTNYREIRKEDNKNILKKGVNYGK